MLTKTPQISHILVLNLSLNQGTYKGKQELRTLELEVEQNPKPLSP